MQSNQHQSVLKLAACFWFTLWTLTVNAQDFQIQLNNASANAEIVLDFASDSDRDQIVLPEFSAFANAHAFGESAAYQDVYGINAVFANSNNGLADSSNYNGLAETNYEIKVTATGGSGQIPFKFVINAGQLRLNNYARIDQSILSFSEVKAIADIRLNGIGSWEMRAVLELDDNTREPIVYFDPFSRDDFGLGFPSLEVNIVGEDAVVDIPRFEGEVLIDFDEFRNSGLQFSYDMIAQVSLFDSLGAGGFASITDPFGLESGDPLAVPGTEFFLNDRPFSDYPVSSVPEPGISVFFGIAWLGLLRIRKSLVGTDR